MRYWFVLSAAGRCLAADLTAPHPPYPGLVLPSWPSGQYPPGPTQPESIPEYPAHSGFVSDQLNKPFVQDLASGVEFAFTNNKIGANQSFFTGAVGERLNTINAAELGAWPDVNWQALTNLKFSTGVFWFGGCGTVSFHNHPNCVEIDTVIRGTGVFGHLLPDNQGIDFSPPLTPGMSYINPKGSLHFYINLSDEEPLWFDALFAGCTNIGIQSVPGFVGAVPAGVPDADKGYPVGPAPDLLGAFTNISHALASETHTNSPLNPFNLIPGCQSIYHDVVKASNKSSVEHKGPLAPTFETAFTDTAIDPTPYNSGEGGFVNWVVGKYTGSVIDVPVSPAATWPALNQLGDNPGSFAYMMLEANGGMLSPSVTSADGIYTVLNGTAVCFQVTYSLELMWDVVTTNQMYFVSDSVIHFFVSVGDVPLKLWAKFNDIHPVTFNVQNFIASSFPTVLKGELNINQIIADALVSSGKLDRFIKLPPSTADEVHTWALNNPYWTGYPFSGNQSVPGAPSDDIRTLTAKVRTMSAALDSTTAAFDSYKATHAEESSRDRDPVGGKYLALFALIIALISLTVLVFLGVSMRWSRGFTSDSDLTSLQLQHHSGKAKLSGDHNL